MTDEQEVAVTVTTPQVYHDVGEDGRPACQIGTLDQEFRVKSRSQVLPSVEYCEYCAGNEPSRDNSGPERVNEFAELSPADLGLTPMGERR